MKICVVVERVGSKRRECRKAAPSPAWKPSECLTVKGKEQTAKVMVMMARRIRWSVSPPWMPFPPVAAAQGGSAAASPASAVHADEVDDDAEVAGEHGDMKQQQQRRKPQVRGLLVSDEAPRPWAVLGILPVIQQRQGAEEQGGYVDSGQHSQTARRVTRRW